MNVSRNEGRCSSESFRRGWRIAYRSLVMVVLLWGSLTIVSGSGFAAEAQGAERFRVVAGNSDNAYLVNTETGSVWVLTYRTMATGREPIAIPYKFIGISPKTKNEFLMEATPVASPSQRERE